MASDSNFVMFSDLIHEYAQVLHEAIVPCYYAKKLLTYFKSGNLS